MNAIVVLWFVIILFLVFPSTSPTATGTGCVRCHTDEGQLKTLYKPPVIPVGGGEG